MNTFTTFTNRRDRNLVCFDASDNTALLKAICSNSASAHIRTLSTGGPVSVPQHASDDVAAHLNKMGWVKA